MHPSLFLAAALSGVAAEAMASRFAAADCGGTLTEWRPPRTAGHNKTPKLPRSRRGEARFGPPFKAKLETELKTMGTST